MQALVTCWEGCEEDFTAEVPSRGSDELTDGVPVQCDNCGKKYILTVDGDGEIDLQSLDETSLGDVVSDPDATHY